MRLINRPTKEIFAEFPATEAKLPDIRNFIESVLADTPFRRKDITAILLAIEEACTNVIRHAYLYAEGTIKIKISVHREKLGISIYDRGRSFDFEKLTDPNLDHYVKTGRKGGLGIYLIRKVTDKVSYHTSGGVNELRLIKNYPNAKPESVAKGEGLSIRLKFSLWTSLLMLLVIVTVYFVWEGRVVDWRNEQFARTIGEYGNAIASQAANHFINQSSDVEFDEFVRNFARQNQDVRFIYITDTHNQIVASTELPDLLRTDYQIPAAIDTAKTGAAQMTFSSELGNTYYVVEDVTYQNRRFGKLHIGFGEDRLLVEIAQSRKTILLIAAIAMLAVIGAVYWLSNYFVRPIQRLIDGVRRIGKGDLDSKIAVEGAGEFNAIAEAFNEMRVKFKEAQHSMVEQERMRKEMQVAQDIQHTLLPKNFPDIEGFDIATIYRAAKDVGGDYYDFVWIDERTLGIVVADVSGKGVPGSLVMTMIRTAIRLESRGTRSPVEILCNVNEFVTEDVRKGMFITIYLVVIDTQQRKISFASAGHNPMILYRKDEDKTFFLNPKGIPLGITLPEGVNFEDNLTSENVKLKKGDMLVMYTDGITEAMNPKKLQYGMPKFLEFIRDNSDLSPDEFAEKFQDDLNNFTQGAEQNDDITMVVIKEKMEVDEYLYARRKKLLEMVDVQKIAIGEACRQLGFSSSTYYRYKKRFELYGDEGLLNKTLRVDDSPAQLTYNQRNLVLEIIRKNPEFGPTRIKRELETSGNGVGDVEERTIYTELVRLRLNTKRQRFEFSKRWGGTLTPQQEEEYVKLSQRIEQPAQTVDRSAYVEQIKESLQRQEESKLAVFRDRLRELGVDDDRTDVLSAMFEEMEGQVSPEQMRLLFDRVAGRVKALDHEAETKNVLSVARLETLDEKQWEKRAEEGISLEVIKLPDEPEALDFDEYEKKLTGGKKKDKSE
ncbi:MAG: SpoIIE family protein phosphatase [Candidatus Zixiibacteriota bacterium]